MKDLKLIFILVVSCCFSHASLAQDNKVADSVNLITEEATEAINMMHQGYLLDSMSRSEIQQEMQNATGDKAKATQLEERLRRIVVKDSIRKEEQRAQMEKLRKSVVGFPVAPFNDTLFYVYLKAASFGPVQRGKSITERIKNLYNDPFYDPDSFRVAQGEYSYDILYGNDVVIMSVTENDALWAQKEPDVLAKELAGIISKEISEEIVLNSFNNWMKRFGLVALIFLCLSLIIYLINRLFRWFNLLLNKSEDRYLNGLIIRKVRLLTAVQFQKFATRFTNTLRIITIIIAVYFSLPLLFSVFPDTKNWTRTIIIWTMTPVRSVAHSILNYLPNLFTILVIYFIFRYAIKGIRYFVSEIAKGNIRLASFHADWAFPTFNIIKFLMYALMLVLIFPYLPGSSSPAFQGVSVFLGVLFSLGSSSAISNIVAGYVITYMRPFKVGDRVKIGELTGDVMEKTMLVIKMRTIKNEDITLPNSTVLSSSTINYSTNTAPEAEGVIIHTTVTIGYDVPWRQMHQALITASSRVPLILKTPAPFVLQTSLDDFYVSYQINAYIREANKLQEIYSELHACIQDACNEAGIEIMSPHYRSLRDGNTTSIPSDYLDKDYKPPAFKVEQTGK